MPAIVIPPEVWSRIFFFVAPPLPHVGMEKESFVEDAKQWRGDDGPGLWKDIDNLMLVSKRVNGLVSPIFWSYLVLTSTSRARICFKLLVYGSQTMREVIFGSVKVLVLPQDLNSETGEHPCLRLLRYLHNVTHIHLCSEPLVPTSLVTLVHLAARDPDRHVPLTGLTGLLLGGINWDAAMLALRILAPSLRQLSLWTLGIGPPTAASFHGVQPAPSPHLEALATGSCVALKPGPNRVWIEEVLFARWSMPSLTKMAIGSRISPSMPHGPSTWARRDGNSASCNSLYLPGMISAARSFGRVAKHQPKEVAFKLGVTFPLGLNDFRGILDQAPSGQAPGLEVIVIVEGESQRPPLHQEDICLIELVNTRRLPALDKVVWVSAGPREQEQVWSTTLAKWIHSLGRQGVLFEIE